MSSGPMVLMKKKSKLKKYLKKIVGYFSPSKKIVTNAFVKEISE